MAKIEYHKNKIELAETKKIDSIVGQKYLDDYETRKQKQTKIMQKNGKTAIKAKNILIGNCKTEE